MIGTSAEIVAAADRVLSITRSTEPVTISLSDIAERLGGRVRRGVTYTSLKRKGGGCVVKFDHTGMMNDALAKLDAAFPESQRLTLFAEKQVLLNNEDELLYFKLIVNELK